MAFTDLDEGVAEIFAEAQDVIEYTGYRIVEDLSGGNFAWGSSHSRRDSSRGLRNAGFRIFSKNNVPNTEQRKADLRRYEHARAERLIRERLLAGERPKLGGPGRPPTRWFKVAKELGIDLNTPHTGGVGRSEGPRSKDQTSRIRIGP